MPQVIDRMNRTEFAEEHQLKIERTSFTFIDTPGQKAHKSIRLNTIRKAMQQKDVDGILNVVCYGYHEGRGDPNEAVTEVNEINYSYLKSRQNEEKELLNEWTPLLGGGVTASWLITVVTKADLWWDQHDKIISY